VLLGGVLTDDAELVVDLLRQRAGRRGGLRGWRRSCSREPGRARQRFDLPGAVLVTAGLSSFVYAITQAGRTAGWRRDRRLLRRAVVLLVGFVAWELRHPSRSCGSASSASAP
jgi:hypothetical protein